MKIYKIIQEFVEHLVFAWQEFYLELMAEQHPDHDEQLLIQQQQQDELSHSEVRNNQLPQQPTTNHHND